MGCGCTKYVDRIGNGVEAHGGNCRDQGRVCRYATPKQQIAVAGCITWYSRVCLGGLSLFRWLSYLAVVSSPCIIVLDVFTLVSTHPQITSDLVGLKQSEY